MIDTRSQVTGSIREIDGLLANNARQSLAEPILIGFQAASLIAGGVEILAGRLLVNAGAKGVNTWWVGSEGRAAAANSGGTILLPSENAVRAAAEGNIKPMVDESVAAARAATGPQRAFIGEGSGNIFYKKELPNLIENVDNGQVPYIEITF